jgi:hypothetical protein
VIKCASTCTAVVLRLGRRKEPSARAGEPRRGQVLHVGAVAGAVAAGRVVRRLRRGTPAPADQREEQPPSDRRSRSVCDNVDVATFRYPTATELRVYVIQSTYGLDHRRFIIDVPGSRFGYLHGGR